MSHKKAHFGTRKRPFLIIVFWKNERRKIIHPHASGVLLFTPARRQYRKSEDIRDTSGAFLLIEIHFARSKSFSVHFSISLIGGKKVFLLEKAEAATAEDGRVSFFLGRLWRIIP